MSEQKLPKPELRREIRLGLVVYGGVSLAIYMNGVCREFYNAVRGRGLYKLIKALTDADIVVDIISGTSAGGINGILLSYALSNSSEEEVVDFAEFASIWRESGDIQKLMYQPSNDPKTSGRESLLDGEGYYQNELKNAFKQASLNKTQATGDEWFSDSNELDLFVTGTDILGKVHTFFDDTGKVVEVNNHRAIFHLKHRRERKEPFNPYFGEDKSEDKSENTYQALAKLCRITSCFPVAFPVVTVKLEAGEEPADDKLVLWGDLTNRQLPETPPSGGYQLHFVDGGVLDNRPFSYTINEMYYRVANCPVERKLFYIDPKPDVLIGSEKFKQMPKPDVWQIVQDSLVGMPTYESISSDLEMIKQHNETVLRYEDLFAQVEPPITSISNPESGLGVSEEIYLRSRLIGLRERVLPLVLRIDQNDTDFSNQYKQSILAKAASILSQDFSSSDRNTKEAILNRTSQQIRNLDVDYSLRKHQYIVRKIRQLMDQQPESAEYDKLRTLVSRLNRQIKLLEVVNTGLNRFLSNSVVSYNFYVLLEKEPALYNQSRREEIVNEDIYDSLIKLHRFFLDADSLKGSSAQITTTSELELELIPTYFFHNLPSDAAHLNSICDLFETGVHDWLSQPLITEVLQKLQARVDKLCCNQEQIEQILSNPIYGDNSSENDSNEFSTSLRKVELASENLIALSESRFSEEILLSFQRFRELDEVLYSFEYVTKIGSKDLIQTFRISPEDAALGFGASFEDGKRLDGKLAGDSLRAFGGFFKKSWRSNDILWGRFDGLNRLVEALVTPESITNFSSFLQRQFLERTGEYRNQSWDEFQANYITLLLQESFPNLAGERYNKLRENLLLLANPSSNLTESELKQIINDLVLEGHREILKTDLKIVIEDEIDEQIEWNLQKVKPDSELDNLLQPTSPKYEPVPGYFGQTVTSLVAAQLAKDALTSLPKGEEYFFRHQYKIGSEKLLTDIPTVILAALAVRASLVVRDVFGNLFGAERSSKIGRSIIYRIVDKTLRVFYWWLQLRGPQVFNSLNFRNNPPLIPLIQIVLLVITLLGIIITISQSLLWSIIALVAALIVWFLESIQDS